MRSQLTSRLAFGLIPGTPALAPPASAQKVLRVP